MNLRRRAQQAQVGIRGFESFTAAGALLMIVFACGCQMQSSGNRGPVPPTAPVSATITFCNDGMENCEPATVFSVAGLRDLVINVAFENVPPGNHVQQLEILLPGGGPYRVTQRGLLISGDVAGAYSLTRNLAVVGTPISLRHMTGMWSVRASLDGQVIATQPVELNP